jgi:hypothetical protein
MIIEAVQEVIVRVRLNQSIGGSLMQTGIKMIHIILTIANDETAQLIMNMASSQLHHLLPTTVPNTAMMEVIEATEVQTTASKVLTEIFQVIDEGHIHLYLRV